MKQTRAHEKRTYLITFVLVVFLLETSMGCSSIRGTTDYVKGNYEFHINGIPVSQLVPKTPEEHLALSLRPITEWDEEWVMLVLGLVVAGGFIAWGLCETGELGENVACGRSS